MPRSHALLAWMQALVLLAAAIFCASRWLLVTWVIGLAAGLQVVAGLAILLRRERLARVTSRVAAFGTLASYVFLLSLALQVVVHVHRHFGGDSLDQALALVGALLLLAPWFVVIPLLQIFRAGSSKVLASGGALLLLLLVLTPSLLLTWAERPTRTFATVDGEALARHLLRRVHGQEEQEEAFSPRGTGPSLLSVALLEKGEIVATAWAEGGSLEETLSSLHLPVRPSVEALYLDVAVEQAALARPLLLPSPLVLVRPAEVGLLGTTRFVGTLDLWRKKVLTSWAPLPFLRLPALSLASFKRERVHTWVRCDSWLATPDGVTSVRQTWAAPPQASADAVRDAALAGARFIARNQAEDGRFAYVVKGPSGEHGAGYNYPRHAGATWFLARVASRTEDPEVLVAAKKALEHLVQHSSAASDGRVHVLDPQRHDGRAWVGTTSLALLAALELGDRSDTTLGWTRQVISAVDAEGLVRGDMVRKTGEWVEKKRVTYAQGQGLLALAAAARGGLPGAEEALTRAASFVDRDYWPLQGGRFLTLDEHWMCLASLAASRQLGRRTAFDVCEAYVDLQGATRAPLSGPLLPVIGAEAGLAEAVVARAAMDREGLSGVEPGAPERWALAYAPALLSGLYQVADAPLLVRPERLLGGFRDRPWILDVRVDAVQHIGCALLGIERLMRGVDLPGSLP